MMLKITQAIDKLKSTADGDGNLLDHSLILFGSGMGNSNEHNHNPLPMLLAAPGSASIPGIRPSIRSHPGPQ